MDKEYMPNPLKKLLVFKTAGSGGHTCIWIMRAAWKGNIIIPPFNYRGAAVGMLGQRSRFYQIGLDECSDDYC